MSQPSIKDFFASDDWTADFHKKLCKAHKESYDTIQDTKDTLELLQLYKGSFAREINAFLRKDKSIKLNMLKETYEKADKLYDDLISMHKWPSSSVKLYRGVMGDHAKTISRMKVGSVLMNPGYSSTAFDPRHALGFGTDEGEAVTLIIIHIPKGFPYFYLDGLRDAFCTKKKNKHERWAFQTEILLKKDVKMRIIKKEGKKKKIYGLWLNAIDCEYSPFESPDYVSVLHVKLEL
jgi:hypothetical protein